MSSFTNKNGNAQPKLDGPNDLTPKWKTSYIIQKEAAEAERAAVEKLMSRLETTGLDVDERFRIAQGG